MLIPGWLKTSDEIRDAVENGRPIVALESTLISHGLPWPTNFETALAAESAVRNGGAAPATIAILDGQPTVGLREEQIRHLATAANIVKATRRDLATVIQRKQTASTTVAATMFLAHQAGIRVFATGGIGGAHRGCEQTFDISSDLYELSRTPMLVVCAGAKSILDLPKTLEILETLGVPVVGYGTDYFPAFYVRASQLRLSDRVDSPEEAAQRFAKHRELGGGGMILAQPIAEEVALQNEELDSAIKFANAQAEREGIRGSAVTPFVLKRISELTGGQSLRANQALIVANATLATAVARNMCAIESAS